MKKLAIFLLVLVMVLLPLTVKADVRVNGDTGESVFGTNIATNWNNRVVIAWSLETATNHNLMVQRYDSLGNRVGSNIVAKSIPSDTVIFPTSAIMNSQGDFIIAWYDFYPPNPYIGMDAYIKVLNFDGTPISTIQVSDTQASWQREPKLAMDTSGNFVCVWKKSSIVEEVHTLHAQLFDNQYQKIGSNFTVDDSAAPEYLGVGMNGLGDFAVTYHNSRRVQYYGYVLVKLFNVTGQPETLFQVNQAAAATWPDIAMNSKGRSVVVWKNEDDCSIWAQILDEGNQLVGTEFMVSVANNCVSGHPEIAINEKGNFVVTWQDRIGSDSIIYSQRYLADGTKIGEKYRVNDSTQASMYIYLNRNFDAAATDKLIYYTWVSGNGDNVYAKRVDWCYPTKRGDANSSGETNISDVIYLINYLFRSGPFPQPFVESGNVNGDKETNIVDVVYLIKYLFKGGQPPYQVPDFASS